MIPTPAIVFKPIMSIYFSKYIYQNCTVTHRYSLLSTQCPLFSSCLLLRPLVQQESSVVISVIRLPCIISQEHPCYTMHSSSLPGHLSAALSPSLCIEMASDPRSSLVQVTTEIRLQVSYILVRYHSSFYNKTGNFWHLGCRFHSISDCAYCM